MLLQDADYGVPLTKLHLQEALQIFISGLPAARKGELPFRDNTPVVRFLRAFEKHNRKELKLAIPTCHAGRRHAATNAETLTTHFACLDALISKFNIDASRLWNLDETVGIAGRDESGNSKRRRYLRSNTNSEMRLPEFVRSARATVLQWSAPPGRQVLPFLSLKEDVSHFAKWPLVEQSRRRRTLRSSLEERV